MLGHLKKEHVDVLVPITPVLLIQEYYYEPKIQRAAVAIAVMKRVM
jgi:hypothetical protein